MAERLHDLARNSMDSVGVSGRAHDEGSQLAGARSSIFSSRRDKHWETHELTVTNNQTDGVSTAVLLIIILEIMIMESLNMYLEKRFESTAFLTLKSQEYCFKSKKPSNALVSKVQDYNPVEALRAESGQSSATSGAKKARERK